MLGLSGRLAGRLLSEPKVARMLPVAMPADMPCVAVPVIVPAVIVPAVRMVADPAMPRTAGPAAITVVVVAAVATGVGENVEPCNAVPVTSPVGTVVVGVTMPGVTDQVADVGGLRRRCVGTRVSGPSGRETGCAHHRRQAHPCGEARENGQSSPHVDTTLL